VGIWRAANELELIPVFEEARLLGPTERSIIVQTREGTNITNVIEPAPGNQQRQLYLALLQRYGSNWEERKRATGGYNCAGHIWASRRTALLDPEEWRVILREDGYRQLSNGELRAPGDLVLYIEQRTDEILHVARIVWLRQGVVPNAQRIPWVLSKWNSTSGEVLHSAYDVPYEDQKIPVRMEWWCDRPISAESRQ
jgi:hypothetical protein